MLFKILNNMTCQNRKIKWNKLGLEKIVLPIKSLPEVVNKFLSRCRHISLTMGTHVRSKFQGKGVFFQLCPRTFNVREI